MTSERSRRLLASAETPATGVELPPRLTQAVGRRGSAGLVAGESDPLATRELARAVARLLWEWGQRGRPGAVVEGPQRTGER